MNETRWIKQSHQTYQIFKMSCMGHMSEVGHTTPVLSDWHNKHKRMNHRASNTKYAALQCRRAARTSCAFIGTSAVEDAITAAERISWGGGGMNISIRTARADGARRRRRAAAAVAHLRHLKAVHRGRGPREARVLAPCMHALKQKHVVLDDGDLAATHE